VDTGSRTRASKPKGLGSAGRFLAPRVLHFGRREIVFECWEIRPSEALPSVGSVLMTSPGLKCPEIWSRQSPERLYNFWGSIIRNYGRYGLTRASDKLVAISGVARFLKARTSDHYILGVWRKNLIKELIWRRTGKDFGATY